VTTEVLLTAYNGEAWLPAQLDSLLSQSVQDFTVLLQDDGSGDRTPEILREYASRDPRFSLGKEQGQHLGAAGNFLSLIRQTRADAVLLCDQDDRWEPEKIAALREALLNAEAQYGSETPLLIHSDCSVIDEADHPIYPSFFRHQGWDPKAVGLRKLLVQNNVTGCTLIMNRPLISLIAEYGRAKDLFMHDWFIALTAASFGRICFLDQPLTRYRQHGENAIGASRTGQIARGFTALNRRQRAKKRIALTYTHAKVFVRLCRGALPEEADRIISGYLETQKMGKLRRVITVRRGGYTMQSPVTRLGQMIFG